MCSFMKRVKTFGVLAVVALLASCNPTPASGTSSSPVPSVSSSSPISSSSEPTKTNLLTDTMFDDLAQGYDLQGYSVSYYASVGKDGKDSNYSAPTGNYWRYHANDESYECIHYNVKDTDADLTSSSAAENPERDLSKLIKKYKSTGEVTKHPYYYKDKDGNTGLSYLGLDNKTKEGSFGATWPWKSSGFQNPFNDLDAKQFVADSTTADSDGLYSFTYAIPESEQTASTDPAKMTLGYQFGNLVIGTDASSPITSVTIKTDGTKIVRIQFRSDVKVTSTGILGTSTVHYFDLYDMGVVALGGDVEMHTDKPLTSYKAADGLKEKLDYLRNNTFTETNAIYQYSQTYDSSDYSYLTSYWKLYGYTQITKGTTSYQIKTYEKDGDYGGMKATSTYSYLWDQTNKTIQPLKNINQKNYKSASAFVYEDNYFSIVPTLSMSEIFFDKVSDNVYTYDANKWVGEYPLDNYSYYLDAFDGMPIRSMTLAFAEDGSLSVAIDSSNYLKADITYSNVGKTKDPIAADSVATDSNSLTWKDMVDSEYYATFATAGWNDDLVNKIPTLGGNYVADLAYVDESGDGGFLYILQYPGDTTDAGFTAIIDQYKTRLSADTKWSTPAQLSEQNPYAFTTTYADSVSITKTETVDTGEKDSDGNAVTKEEQVTKNYTLSLTYGIITASDSYALAILPTLTEVTTSK